MEISRNNIILKNLVLDYLLPDKHLINCIDNDYSQSIPNNVEQKVKTLSTTGNILQVFDKSYNVRYVLMYQK
jgi:hypothetical protein